jgi:hypothetical protein
MSVTKQQCTLTECLPVQPKIESAGEPISAAIFPWFGGHAGLADDALFGLFGREIPEGRVHAVPIVVSFDVSVVRTFGAFWGVNQRSAASSWG